MNSTVFTGLKTPLTWHRNKNTKNKKRIKLKSVLQVIC